MGAKPPRRVPNKPFLHASQKSAAEADIDFNSLGLEYKLVRPATFESAAKGGWTAESTERPNYPFLVERTKTGFGVPVYTDYKGGNTKVITIIRKIKGDVQKLKSDLEKVVGQEVEVRPGKIIVNGNYQKRVTLWLVGLGF